MPFLPLKYYLPLPKAPPPFLCNAGRMKETYFFSMTFTSACYITIRGTGRLQFKMFSKKESVSQVLSGIVGPWAKNHDTASNFILMYRAQHFLHQFLFSGGITTIVRNSKVEWPSRNGSNKWKTCHSKKCHQPRESQLS